MLHVSHHEKMHFPIIVGITGFVGLIVNFITLSVVGGISRFIYCTHKNILAKHE